jgi:hypothetical protein
VTLSNDTLLDPRGGSGPGPTLGGTVLINGGKLFSAQQSTIFAVGQHGGTIQVQANQIRLTDSWLAAFGSNGDGGHITLDAKNTQITNSQLRSNSFGSGQGGTITITSPGFHQDVSSTLDVSSQFGTPGTVTINGVVQP